MSIAKKLQTIAENEQKVYDAGRQAEYDAFWDSYTTDFTRGSYEYAFCGSGWNDDTFKPKSDIVLTNGYSGTNMFWNCYVTDLAEAFAKHGVRLDISKCNYASSMFQQAKTKRLPELNVSNVTYDSGLNMFCYNAKQLETIDKIVVSEGTKISTNSFQGCEKLSGVVFEGVIGRSINFQWSTLLSHDSIVSIINALYTTASGKSITLSKTAVNNAFEGGSTGSEWLNLIATKSNWTISLV